MHTIKSIVISQREGDRVMRVGVTRRQNEVVCGGWGVWRVGGGRLSERSGVGPWRVCGVKSAKMYGHLKARRVLTAPK